MNRALALLAMIGLLVSCGSDSQSGEPESTSEAKVWTHDDLVAALPEFEELPNADPASEPIKCPGEDGCAENVAQIAGLSTASLTMEEVVSEFGEEIFGLSEISVQAELQDSEQAAQAELDKRRTSAEENQVGEQASDTGREFTGELEEIQIDGWTGYSTTQIYQLGDFEPPNVLADVHLVRGSVTLFAFTNYVDDGREGLAEQAEKDVREAAEVYIANLEK